jgi:hypothetical protein
MAIEAAQLVFDGQKFTVRRESLSKNCRIFHDNPSLLARPYHVRSHVTLKSCRVFCEAIDGASIHVTRENVSDLAELCNEFKFEDLMEKVRQFQLDYSSILELFDCQTFIISLELDTVKPKQVHISLQLMEMPPLEITSFEAAGGNTDVKRGIRYLARVECFAAFQKCPVYIFLTTSDMKVIGACGFDLQPMIVDAYRHSSDPDYETVTYNIALDIQNRWDQVIGKAFVDFAVRHFSSDTKDIYCLEDRLPPLPPPEPAGADQPTVQDDRRVHKSTMARRKKLPRVYPRLSDLLILNKKYQTARGQLQAELVELEHEVKLIEASKHKKKARATQQRHGVARRRRDTNFKLRAELRLCIERLRPRHANLRRNRASAPAPQALSVAEAAKVARHSSADAGWYRQAADCAAEAEGDEAGQARITVGIPEAERGGRREAQEGKAAGGDATRCEEINEEEW